MVEIKVTVCDVCEDPARETKSYTVTSEDRSATTDRCDEHGAPFEALLGGAKPAKRAASTGARGGGRRSRVTSIEEIEARKRKS